MKEKETPSINENAAVIETNIGKIALFFRPEPFFISRVCFPRNHSEEESPAYEVPRLFDVIDMITDYFFGEPITTPWDILDMTPLTDKQRAVLEATERIPYGEVKSYKEMAEFIGSPRAYRFVGNTLAANPFPLLIPCHRVVRTDGAAGKFGGGADLKKRLISLERHYRFSDATFQNAGEKK